jgi:DNA-binding LacI/PurR family transcriptional regulator
VNPRTTVCDIADKLKVHQSTVSRALKNDRRISKATRDLVMATAKEMNYCPDPMLTSLVAYRKSRVPKSYQSTVGWITNYPTRTGWRRYERNAYYVGACRRAAELGYKVEEFWLGEPGMTQHRAIQILSARNIRGLLFSPQPRSYSHLNMDWSKFSAIMFGRSIVRPAFHNVDNDHYRSFTLIMRQLKRLGYRRPGFAIWPLIHEMTDRLWTSAFTAFQPLPLQKQIPVFIEKNWTFREFKKWFLSHRPDSVISHDETVLGWIQEMGFRVPTDVGFVLAAKHAEFSSHCSGVDENSELVAETAMNILADMIHRGETGIPKSPISTLIEGRWIEGATLKRVKIE